MTRRLKVEATGDQWKQAIRPKIRITGRWLESAGFPPGSHVRVVITAPGVMTVTAEVAA